MTNKKKITLSITVLGLLFILFAVWYKYQYSMDTAKSFEVNTSMLDRKLIIATQGSEFKNETTKNIVEFYKPDSIYIKVVDISSLSEIDPQNWNALVIMHTWENWKPPIDVKAFIDRTQAFQNKIVVLTTSGQGSFKMKGIDAITGESKLENTASFTHLIIERLDPLLKP
ncbi:hypothetical protein N9B67_00995 [Algibacter sp.]|nr:hypothetical protein [Algibacter sp.]MDA9069239.1 hypothetical protein [Algibacter sp.]MDA9774872.1 hypothetical protein [Algibacter sp.]